MIRKKYIIQGQIQGVGFRPFIYKIATQLNLKGYIKNNNKGVELEIEGTIDLIEKFNYQLNNNLPPLARIDTTKIVELEPLYKKQFEIIQSENNINHTTKTALVPPDIAVCKECLKDICSFSKNNYFQYFATNCTNCGPRYSIIQTIPYDRDNTSMDKFKMCPSCQQQYLDPLNRRYHAQPISCNFCGPKLELSIKNKIIKKDSDIKLLKQVSRLIKDGKIGAIKGIGGFHIVCDATNDKIIKNLRKYKNRPSKPFAVMCKNLQMIKEFAYISKAEKNILTSKEAPIVILNKNYNKKSNLSKYIAPNINKIGSFLPYSALHHLLFKFLDNPIVATSANLGGEPIIIKSKEIKTKLPFVDFILDFNREIINAVDDSLIQLINNKTQILRSARGFTPKVIKLPKKIDKKILAVGANSKNTISIAFDNTMILSAHIGNLDNIESLEYFKRTIKTFKKFYNFEPDLIVCDKHPNYETTKWTRLQNKPIVQIQHHLAHIYAVKAEFNHGKKNYIGFSFDGTGYGTDRTLWGGEVFINDKRKYSFKPIKLLGGNKAIKEPRRVALAMLFENHSLEEIINLDLPLVNQFTNSELKILYQSYKKSLNSFDTSSVGRLFDAIVSFCDILQITSYEGESGLLCESYYDKNIKQRFAYTIVDGIIDIKIVDFILNNNFNAKLLCTMLINTLYNIILEVSKNINSDIILTGGVFQNKTLLTKITTKLDKIDKNYLFSSTIPTNDGGISLGQIYYFLSNNKLINI